jgi:hypothetical protein
MHSLAGKYFSDVAALDLSRGPVSQLPVSCRQLCELEEDGYRAFRTSLSRLMLEAFSSEKILDVDDRARDVDSEIIDFCKQEGKTIGGQDSLDTAKKYLEMYNEVRPNCQSDTEAYEKIEKRIDLNKELNERSHPASTIGKYVRQLKAAKQHLGL